MRNGTTNFEGCPVSRCYMYTVEQNLPRPPDAVVYRDDYHETKIPRTPNQVNILFHQESPYKSCKWPKPDMINWTMTYRKDSDIVIPYGIWTPYDNKVIRYTFIRLATK